ncbi:PadR family transcriptional regulator [Erythrobacter sp. SN021]|uniref:PadR family transcriptional regulator n=1 Tax=Erythrobacter sp. SN021 TaxID=2912574 RepID=UPI001F476691|nr:PadR family transcriptional regulator [Erythrobacter sp. SN021]MCF8882371.1 PadR family transcriptional regulator [Erythrobacter sp. SN021]
MHKAHKWRKMRRMGGWPFVAAMMAEAECKEGLGASARFGGPGWTFDFGPRGGGRRRRRMFGSGELRLVLLKLVADEPRHGYELIKAIEELTEGAYAPSPGTIYPTLSLLEDEGAIAQAAGDETRKAYEATDAGRTELEERADEVDALFERLSGHGEHRRAFATPEMFRALGNLAGVLKNRARSGKLDEETMREIVDLVDELAKKIERL